MTILAQDTFTRADQSGWGTSSDGNTWAILASSSTQSIASNEGVSVVGGTDCSIRLGSGTAGTVNITTRYSTSFQNAGVIFRVTDGSNYYRCVLEAGTLYLQYCSSGSFHAVASSGMSGYADGDYWHIRAVAVGTTIQASAWKDGNSEPTLGSQINATDSTFSSGGYGVINVNGTAHFDNFVVTDNASATHLRISDGYGGVFS